MGGIICYALKCTENATIEEFWSAFGLSVLVVAGIVLLVRVFVGTDKRE